MSDALRVAAALQEIIESSDISSQAKSVFSARLKQGKLTRDDNPYSHFCVYFAALDPALKQVFIGHHKKSGLWLFNGGHMDKGETPQEAVIREMGEEWGNSWAVIPKPALLTLTQIEKPQAQICQWHYDIWYFVPVDKNSFHPDQALLAKEFHEIGWKSLSNARAFVTDPSTHTALKYLESSGSTILIIPTQ